MFALVPYILLLSATVQGQQPDWYDCIVSPRTGAFGTIFYRMDVSVDGTQPFHRVQWQIPKRKQGLELSVQWDGEGPFKREFDDRSTVRVYFWTLQGIRDEVRIEIRRADGKRYPGEFAFAGNFQKQFKWPDKPTRYYVEGEGRWGEMKAWMNGQPSLIFALVKKDGTVVAQDQLSAETLAGASVALADILPDAQAIAADYLNRCSVPEPIIIN